METYQADRFRELGVAADFVQDNEAGSARAGTIRGLHFQKPPHAQAKLVRVLRGAIFDVAVDIRAGSPTFGQHVGAELSADNWRQLLVPAGFAHGFVTLTDNCAVLYKVTADYAPQSEGGLAWNDPALGIDWPLPASEIVTNARDGAWPTLAELEPLPAA